MFSEIGRGVLISILDRVEKNPFSRLSKTVFLNMEGLRKSLALEILSNEERFKMLDIKAYQKAKSINKCCYDIFHSKIEKQW